MGITIHYHGKAKNPEAIGKLVDILAVISLSSSWKHNIIHNEVKGIYEPSWG